VQILHACADDGVESEALAQYGDVTRVGLNPTDKNQSQPVQANIKKLPFADNSFDLSLWHPPCGYVSPLSDTKGGNREDWENLIPVAREQAQRVSEHYIIENKAEAAKDMDDPIILEGEMFGKPFEYKRAFETSFPVSEPPAIQTLGRTEMQPFFSSEHSTEQWAAAKGYPPKYSKGHLAKNCVPRAYVEHLLRAYFEAVDSESRPDYTEYDKEMDAQRSQAQNSQLSQYE